MEDNKIVWVIALLFGVWLISGSPDLSNLFILTGEEGYIIEPDFSSGALDPNIITVTGTVTTPTYAGEPIKQGTDPRGNYQLITTTSPPQLVVNIPAPYNIFDAPNGNVNFVKDYKGQNFRVDISGAAGPIISVLNERYEENGACRLEMSVTDLGGVYEVISGDLNPDEIIVRYKGRTICNTVHQGKLQFRFNVGSDTGRTRTLIFTNPRFQPKVLPACNLDSNDLLAAETFTAGQTIDYFSTRFPTKSYCLSSKAIITDVTAGGITSTNEIYYLLKSGGTYTIPSGQTMTLFYVFDNDGLVPTTCDVTQEVYSVDQSKCVPATGIVQVCSSGIYDAQQGVCVVQNVNVCAEGRLEVINNIATCVVNPPVNQQCQTGTFDPATGTCEVPPSKQCAPGYTAETLPSGALKCSAPLVISQAPLTTTAGIASTPTSLGKAASVSVPTTAAQIELPKSTSSGFLGVPYSFYIFGAVLLALVYFISSR